MVLAVKETIEVASMTGKKEVDLVTEKVAVDLVGVEMMVVGTAREKVALVVGEVTHRTEVLSKYIVVGTSYKPPHAILFTTQTGLAVIKLFFILNSAEYTI